MPAVNCALAAIHVQLIDDGRYIASVRDVPSAESLCRRSRPPRSATPSGVSQAGTAAGDAQPDVGLGHHEIEGPVWETYFHRYFIHDIFSCDVLGWKVIEQESAELAEQLIADSAMKEHILTRMLTLHADRGSSMRSKSVATRSPIWECRVAQPALCLRRQSVLEGPV